MLVIAVRSKPLRILAAPGQWPALPETAALALQSASVVLWQRGADPSLLATLRQDQRQCELSHARELPSLLPSAAASSADWVLIQAPDAAPEDWHPQLGPDFPGFESIAVPTAKKLPDPAQVILTRSHTHNLELGRALLQAGVSSLSLPTLAFAPAPDPEKLTKTLNNLGDFFGVIVSSPRGAKVLAQASQLPEALKIVAVGASTAAALQQHQLPCHLVPGMAHSEGLVAALQQAQWLDRPWLHLRGNLGRDVLKVAIESAQGQYTLLCCYQSLLPEPAPALLEASQAPDLKLVCFASGQSYINYKRMLATVSSPAKLQAQLRRLQILSFGPITSEAIRKDGQEVSIELTEPSASRQLQAITQALSN